MMGYEIKLICLFKLMKKYSLFIEINIFRKTSLVKIKKDTTYGE
jgi:hypothetical protein